MWIPFRSLPKLVESELERTRVDLHQCKLLAEHYNAMVNMLEAREARLAASAPSASAAPSAEAWASAAQHPRGLEQMEAYLARGLAAKS